MSVSRLFALESVFYETDSICLVFQISGVRLGSTNSIKRATGPILGAILDPAGSQGESQNHVFGYHVGKMTKKGCPKTRPEKTSKFD